MPRNITNIDELDSYIEGIADDDRWHEEFPEVERWLRRKFRRYMINRFEDIETITSFVDPTHPGRESINRDIKLGRPVHKLCLSSPRAAELRESMLLVMDFFHDVLRGNPDIPPGASFKDIRKLSVEEALTKAVTWKDWLEKSSKFAEDLSKLKVVHEHDDGFVWVEVNTPESLDREGQLMKHCVSSRASRVREGKCKIFSLRDCRNIPHVTMEIQDGSLMQVKGRYNTLPSDRYEPHVVEFLGHLGLNDREAYRDHFCRHHRWKGLNSLGSCRYAHAADSIERSLVSLEHDSQADAEALMNLADAQIMIGSFDQAIRNLIAAFRKAENRNRGNGRAFHAYYQLIEAIRCKHEAEGNESDEKVAIRFQLIEAGFHWLRAAGKLKWRHVLLFQKAVALSAVNQNAEALQTIEEAYALKRQFGGPGYAMTDYGWRVAKQARLAGEYHRGLEVLDEMEDRPTLPLIRLKILVERSMLLRCDKPPRLKEALEYARRAAAKQVEVEHPKMATFTYTELARCAVSLALFDEARLALGKLRRAFLQDLSHNRCFMRRGMRNCLIELEATLQDTSGPGAEFLRDRVAYWLEEIEDAELKRQDQRHSSQLRLSVGMPGD